MSHTIVDPQITVHWSNISTADESLIKIAFTSQGYENIRYSLMAAMNLHIASSIINQFY